MKYRRWIDPITFGFSVAQTIKRIHNQQKVLKNTYKFYLTYFHLLKLNGPIIQHQILITSPRASLKIKKEIHENSIQLTNYYHVFIDRSKFLTSNYF